MEVELSCGRGRPSCEGGEITPSAPEEDNGGAERDYSAAPGPPPEVPRTSHGIGRKSKDKGRRGAPSSSVSSSSSSAPPWQRRGSGVHLRSRRRRESGWGGGGDDLQDLALSLGMSFAAVVAQVYGKRFDSFMRNFGKSFHSTLKTLQVIQGESMCEQHNHFSPSRNCSDAASTQDILESLNSVEEIQENCPMSSVDNQLILQAEVNQQLAHLSQRSTNLCFSQSALSTLEKSVMEQARSNDLKAVEIGLIIRKLQLKKSQLDLSSYASFLERVKISMGISKASFKEEKLRNEIRDFRLAELLRMCTDLLVAGLILMSCLLVYGAYVFSYRRISEATSSCVSTAKEAKSWWVPKPVASFNSGWLFLRCHVVVISRMFFGVLMILAIAYSVFQRSASSGSAMKVTFILLLLGAACGAAGKLCVDTLGGNGYYWLFYWEIYCLLHFLANAFPSHLYYILCGPVSVSPEATKVVLPYWVRRFTFYTILVLILPILSGLMPFASLREWQDHLVNKMFPSGEWD
ncbi:hypothetical protein Taro_033917 [Colocasia esculenta]|uniref:Protein CPR-5 n=1 Tax=Colocasia esculenta TaxID=4460 RepID=A0A843VWG2_COLES|nr:hypothetical protein [Colocasia esculenta]